MARKNPTVAPIPTRLDQRGREIPDPTPIAIPINFHKPETLDAKIMRLTRQGISDNAAQNGKETFEESNDFNIPDDGYDPVSPHETDLDDEIIGNYEKEKEIEPGANNAPPDSNPDSNGSPPKAEKTADTKPLPSGKLPEGDKSKEGGPSGPHAGAS